MMICVAIVGFMIGMILFDMLIRLPHTNAETY
jgi:hypothetical protein